MWYVYFLKLFNDHIYVGSTDNLDRRVASHEKGQVQSTKAHLPIDLQSYIAVKTEEHARHLEKYFKSGSGKAVAIKRFIKE